jgi:hypothetical protein
MTWKLSLHDYFYLSLVTKHILESLVKMLTSVPWNLKELYYVKGAGHVDLYDRVDFIPFDKLTDFFNQYLK